MDQKLILNKIQFLLKSKKITYSFLAKKMNLSHQTVKRFFSKGQVTFDNLLKVCTILEINLSDLFYEVEQENMKVFKFTDEQELFFANNPNYLAYFYQLRSKKTPYQIKQLFKISEKSNLKYLKKLKHFGLVKHDGENFICSVHAPIFWDDNGALGQVFSTKMISDLVERAISTKNKNIRPFQDLKNLVLSKSQYEIFKDEIEKLLSKYQSLSTQNSKLKIKNNSSYTSLFLIGEREMNLFNEIYEI